jgi:AcrR family transcriptional regulator
MTAQRNDSSNRHYRLGKREGSMAATRLRIVQATLDLHSTIGPSKTTIASIAERAGVQRHTVYHHFPNLDSLFEACTLHGMETTGMPVGTAWSSIPDAVTRTRVGLREVVAWYRRNQGMLDRVLADADPDASDADDPFTARMRTLFALLRAPWRVARKDRPVADAVLAHALAYETWRSLSSAGIPDDQVVELLVGWVADAATSGRTRTGTRRTSCSTPRPEH